MALSMSETVPAEKTKHKPRQISWLAVPAFGWLLWFILIPIGIVGAYSFMRKGVYGGVVFQPSLENYQRIADPIYLKIYFNSLKLAVFTSVICLMIGYPMAFVMATCKRQLRPLLLVCVMIPFWTNFVIRAYALKVLLGVHGPISSVLYLFGLIHEPMPLTDNALSVWLGMITNYLPFMVLPLYVTLEKFDFTLLEAARDLGASSRQVITQILLPLTRPGLITGLLLVFIPALGEFIIPDMLGGARTMLIGNLITEQFLKIRDWPFGSALSALLMLTVAVGYWINETQTQKRKAAV
jgi:spermidine/putrescine transport system permease protein